MTKSPQHLSAEDVGEDGRVVVEVDGEHPPLVHGSAARVAQRVVQTAREKLGPLYVAVSGEIFVLLGYSRC